MSSSVKPTDHLDWRSYVRAALAARRWKQRDLAQRVGMSEANLSVLLSGRRRLAGEWTAAFCRVLELDGDDARWFGTLVDRESDNDRAREAATLSLRAEVARRSPSTPEGDVVAAQGDWRVNALQELALCEGFRPDPAWMAATLEPRITEAEAAATWATLLETGLVWVREDGGFDVMSVRTDSVLREVQTAASHRLQGAVFDLVRRGWVEYFDNERHGGVITMALSEAAAERALTRLRELEQELVQIALEDAGPRTRVYLLTTQWIPASAYTDVDDVDPPFTPSEAGPPPSE